MPTLNLFEALLVQTADLDVLVPQCLQTAAQGVCDLEFIVVLVRSAVLGVVE